MNILLIGYRGTGKTTVARRLALLLGWPWIDADVELELVAGKSIAAIFQQQGEEAFRQLETNVLRQLAEGDRQVLALGGGVVLREENRRQLDRAGTVVWLKASAATLHQRLMEDPVSSTQRPDLTASGGFQEIMEVLVTREPLYRQCADLEVDTEDKDPSQVADEILARLNLSASES